MQFELDTKHSNINRKTVIIHTSKSWRKFMVPFFIFFFYISVLIRFSPDSEELILAEYKQFLLSEAQPGPLQRSKMGSF